ncbi:Hsp20/alpha crystallin family protein [Litorivivens sp.]|uniref:Hsp20/alpha crystallin family protein n=1 Tax=Litorivivens sp. TaxID=2020868 RepID=UPI003566D132
MTAFTYTPYAWLDDFRRDFSRLVNAGYDQQNWSPAVDLAEDESGYFITMDLPGVNPDDVEITHQSQQLTVKGKRDWEEGERSSLSKERWRGDFLRRFTLPKTADVEHIDAKYSNGVLAIFVPKSREAEPRRIAINVH